MFYFHINRQFCKLLQISKFIISPRISCVQPNRSPIDFRDNAVFSVLLCQYMPRPFPHVSSGSGHQRKISATKGTSVCILDCCTLTDRGDAIQRSSGHLKLHKNIEHFTVCPVWQSIKPIKTKIKTLHTVDILKD